MANPKYIPADEFCVHHKIDYSFIRLLNESGLIETYTIEQTVCIPEDQLPALERMVRLHFEMDINVEGIETINHLLSRIESMQHEITVLKNRLCVYESPGQ